ncbi:MAG: CRTAC1 family protein [Pirellulaceae bacterium]
MIRRTLLPHARCLAVSTAILALAWSPCTFLGAEDILRPVLLRDVTARTGIDFRHSDGGSGRHYIVEYVASGVALFDFDGDALIDVYFLNGAPQPGTETGPHAGCRLYRNEGDFQFRDVTDEAGVGYQGHALGVAVADYDDDGHADIYLSNFGQNVLYHNNGDGTFTDVTATADVGRGNRVGAGTCFLDIDGDGNLDIYAGNYILFSYDRHVPLTEKGVSVYPSPLFYLPDKDTLLRSSGDGVFRDVSDQSGIGAVAGRTMGMVCFDYDNDGHTDVFAGNDAMEDFLFHSDGRGHFEEVGLLAGIAYDIAGTPRGTMGVECGDYDNDGYLDILTTAYQNQTPLLLRNLGTGTFEDVTSRVGLGTIPKRVVTWGAGLVDFDNDGDRDAFFSCGHIQDNIAQIDDTTSYEQQNLLLQNVAGRFIDVSRTSGDGLTVKLASRGAAFDDLDNDGQVDAVILNARNVPTILRNMAQNHHHWIQIVLRGVQTNRSGVGARVVVVCGDQQQVAEVHSGRTYQSHFGTRLHFGLGDRSDIDRIEVRWVGGRVDVLTKDVLEDIGVDRIVTITEGQGQSE